MNIGIVTTWFDRGAAFVSKQFADSLSSDNDIFIFARGGEKYDKESERWQTYPVTWGKVYKSSETQIKFHQFKCWVKKNSIDVVIFNEQKDWEIVVDAKRLGVKTVAYIDYYTQETVPFFALYDGLICNTKRHFSVFNWHPGACYIPWGTDIQTFKRRPEDAVSFDEIVFFHSAGMGGINLRKGTDLLVAAFSQLEATAKLIIHSQVPLESYGATGEKIRNNSNIEFIVDSVPPPGLYHLGNVYVYPSRLDGIGLTVCEALAMGMPVITTDCAPMNEFVQHQQNGLLVKVNKYLGRPDGYYWAENVCCETALAEEMTFCIDHNKKIKDYAENARASAEQHFDWNKNAQLIHGCLEKIISLTSRHDKALGNRALGFTFKERESAWPLYNKVYRKVRRWFETRL